MKIDFYYSESCGHCRQFHSVLEKIIKERPYIELQKVLYKRDEHHRVKYVPTVFVSHGGDELGVFTSALDKEAIDRWLDQLEDYIETHMGWEESNA